MGDLKMVRLDIYETLFVGTAFLFQVILIIHFAIRKWRFQTAIRYGPIVYALSLPALVLSLLLMLSGKTWSLWLSGFLYFIWAVFGYVVDYQLDIHWRSPILWPIFGPYVFLYLATIMFYWFPLANIQKPLWYVYAVLYVISTILNLSSHRASEALQPSA
jgi:hypothetical protein